MPAITTIGYEGASIDDFLATLLAAQIELLIDIREIAGSRRKGFSKNALSNHLKGAQIEYMHLRGLGDPKPGRDAARSGNMERFYEIFSEHMLTENAKSELKRAEKLAESYSVCLLCYERDPFQCHRKIVAEKLSAILKKRVIHLGVVEGLAAKSGYKARIKDPHLGQSVTASY